MSLIIIVTKEFLSNLPPVRIIGSRIPSSSTKPIYNSHNTANYLLKFAPDQFIKPTKLIFKEHFSLLFYTDLQ